MFWAGIAVTTIGNWIQRVVQSWILYEVTGRDARYLGWLGLATAVPLLITLPIGGVIADRLPRVRVLLVASSTGIFIAGVLAALAFFGMLRPWHILAGAALDSVREGVETPPRQSTFPDLVPPEALQNALSLISAALSVSALVGPTIAGFLLGRVSSAGLFALNGASFIPYFATIAFLDLPRGTARPRGGLLDGFSYVARDRVTLLLLVLSAVGALAARSYQQVLPLFAEGVWHEGSRGYGTLLGAAGTGAILGAVLVAPVIRVRERALLLFGLLLGLSLACFALAPKAIVGTALLVPTGAATVVFTTTLWTMIQSRVPAEFRGRVLSIYVLTFAGLPHLGALGMALLSHAIGARLAIFGGALFFVLTVALVSTLLQRTDRADSPPG